MLPILCLLTVLAWLDFVKNNVCDALWQWGLLRVLTVCFTFKAFYKLNPWNMPVWLVNKVVWTLLWSWGKEQVREVLTCPGPCRNRYFARIRAWESYTWHVEQYLSFWKITVDLFCRTLLGEGWILCSNHASAKGTFCFIWNLLHQICHMSPDWKLCLFALQLPSLRTSACLALYPKEPEAQRAVQ